jgi:protein TonB
VALVVHGGVAATLVTVKGFAATARPRTNVELEVVERPPPPPPPPPAPEPPPPPPKAQPRVAMRRVTQTPPPEPPRAPPPTETPPDPPKEPTPPVFGVTVESTVNGESSMAVPVGDTVATNDRTPRKSAPAPGPPGPPAFAPVPESYVAEMPKILQKDPKEAENQGRDIYPAEAARLQIEGTVVLRVGIDRSGAVRSVKVIKPAGYGFDEAAVQSMRRYKWAPARTNDGRPVDFLITFKYAFTPPR